MIRYYLERDTSGWIICDRTQGGRNCVDQSIGKIWNDRDYDLAEKIVEVLNEKK